MDYAILKNDNDFHEWSKYEPLDIQYIRYGESNPSVVAAGHKIGDVYHTFANARQSFMSAGYDNYGDLCGDDEISKLYVKTHFLLHAVIEYAICLDLSWQVVWAYIQPSSFEYLLLQEYKKMEKECDRENLYSQLDCAIAQKCMQAQQLKDIIERFDGDVDVMTLRTLYNSLKHRGIIHFEGLGSNFSSMIGSVQGKTVSTLSRKPYTIEEVENLLFNYHTKFKAYFNEIIDNIMPVDYFETKAPLVKVLETLINMNEIQNGK